MSELYWLQDAYINGVHEIPPLKLRVEVVLIKVSVRYLASFAIAAGRREETLLVPDGITLRELLTKLIERYGSPLKKEIFDPEAKEIKPHVLVLVNGRSVNQLADNLDTKILYGDSVILTLPTSGG